MREVGADIGALEGKLVGYVVGEGSEGLEVGDFVVGIALGAKVGEFLVGDSVVGAA